MTWQPSGRPPCSEWPRNFTLCELSATSGMLIEFLQLMCIGVLKIDLWSVDDAGFPDSADHRPQIPGTVGAHIFQPWQRPGCRVRRNHDVLHLEERVQRVRRLGFKYVAAGSRNPAFLKRCTKRRVIDQPGATGVNQDRVRLHARERVRTNQLPVLGRRSSMQ